jgi:hypothetical protein
MSVVLEGNLGSDDHRSAALRKPWHSRASAVIKAKPLSAACLNRRQSSMD